MFESVNGHTDGHRLESHPISSQRAFGSGELKNKFEKKKSADNNKHMNNYQACKGLNVV